MRLAALLLFLLTAVSSVSANPPQATTPGSAETVLGWMNQYRFKPEPNRVAEAMRAAGRAGAFHDPGSSGVYVGFLAGILNANPTRAEKIIEAILPLPPDQQWFVVRAIAYSGLPEWKGMLHGFKMHMPSRAPMVDMYLDGRLPTLADLVIDHRRPSLFRHIVGRNDKPDGRLEPSPDLIDTFWGMYFATGGFEPIGKLVSMLRWSTNDDDVELLTIGGMAKFTLATNASRNPELLNMLKWTVRYQDEETANILKEVITAADSVETAKLRNEALAAIEQLKRKGPGYKRRIAGWGQIGQGALSLGCIGAAVAGAVAVGLPCVLGGAVSSAALNAWSTQN